MRNKALYDVILSQASAGTLAGKVNIVPEDDMDVDEDGTVTFECRQCMTETVITPDPEVERQPGGHTTYLTQCGSCSLYYKLDIPNSP